MLWDGFLAVALLGLLALLAARLDRRELQHLEGRMVVNDGDSLTLGSERIRLLGIDAPEFNQICRRDNTDYPCGRFSREALRTLIGNGKVSCRGSERDRYGRMLAACSVGGIDLNRRQVETGWAVAYGGYEREENAARLARKGIWAGSFDRPRSWREAHGDTPEGEHTMPGLSEWLRDLFRL